MTPQSSLQPIQVTQASQVTAWELQGKLAVKTPEDKFSTNLYWLHTASRDELKLTTMLGTTVLSLITEPNVATLEVDGKRYQDSDPQKLLQKLSGWAIPIDLLPLWITGQYTPQDIISAVNVDGTPKQIINETEIPAWIVDFVSWQQQSGAQVPQQIKLSRANLQLKIQLTQWQALIEQPKS